MAETPPQGSLLSSFVSGGRVGRPNGSGSGRNNRMVESSPDSSGKLGQLLANYPAEQIANLTPLGLLDLTIQAVNSDVSASRRGGSKRFGGTQDVLDQAWELMRASGLDQQLGYGADKSRFEQEFRAWAEKQSSRGVGKYSVSSKATDWIFHPVATASDQIKSISTNYAWDKFEHLIGQSTRTKMSLTNIHQAAAQLSSFAADQIKDQMVGASETAIKAAQDQTRKLVKGKISGFLTTNGIYKLLRFAWAPADSNAHAFGGGVNGRLGHMLSLAENPTGYLFKNYIWGRPNQSVPSLRLNRFLWKIPGLAKFRKGLWNGILNIITGGRWDNAGSLIGRGLKKVFSKFGQVVSKGLANVAKFIAQKLFFAASQAILAGMGALMGAIGIPVLLIIGATILSVIAMTMVVMMVFIPIFSALNPAASAAPLDLAISVVPTSPVTNVGPNETVSGTIQVTANKAAQNLSVRANFDTNYAPESVTGGADSSVIGAVITWPKTPYPTISVGQSVTFSFSAKTASGMTTTTAAVVRITATSSSSSASANFSVNGAGIPGFDDNVPYGWPVNGTITQSLHSDFGGRFDLVSKGTAVDIGGNNNFRICSTLNGRVVATDDGADGQGPLIVNDTSGFWARFNHMLHGSVAVKVGQQVHRGQFLGLVDTSGLATGPHLHYAIYSSTISGRPGSGPGYGFYQYIPPGSIDSSGQIVSSTINNGITC